MGTITGNELITRAANQLQDPDHTRWSMAELLNYINDCQRDIVMRKPDAYTKSESTVLAISECKQSLPSDAIMLLDISRNLGTDGSTLGRAITRIERPVMDQQWPDWQTDTGAAEVQHYMYDEKDPLNFYVYPPQPAASPGYVELIYSAVPDPVMKTWAPSTAIASFLTESGLYQVLPMINNDRLYRVAAPTGSTGTSEPVWPTSGGGTVVDGDITWTETTFDVPDAITLADIFATLILDYMIAQSLFKDANISVVAGQKGLAHFQAYLSALGVKTQAENVYDPNVPSPAKLSIRGT